MITSVSPAACAASTFCLRPPIGSTRPCSVTSPVMPTVCFTGRPGEERRERGRHRDAGARAVLRDRARRDVHVEASRPRTASSSMPSSVGVRADVGERDPRRLLHHVAELAGEDEPLARPCIAVASTKSTSPPVPVTARPVATPGTAVRSAASWKNRCRPSASRTAGSSIVDRRLGLAGGDARSRSCAAACRARARAGGRRPRACTRRRSSSSSSSRDRDLVLEQAVALALARPEVAARDRDLLVDRVAVEADDLHAVEQRAGDRVGDVRGRDEDDLGEVELDVEVVVAERVVLRRVEHLEQRRRRVAAPVGADLVDLVEQDHRVHRPGVAQGADEPARQRADVGAPVAADLGLVADAAERHADELAVRARGRSTRRSRSCRCRAGRSG